MKVTGVTLERGGAKRGGEDQAGSRETGFPVVGLDKPREGTGGVEVGGGGEAIPRPNRRGNYIIGPYCVSFAHSRLPPH